MEAEQELPSQRFSLRTIIVVVSLLLLTFALLFFFRESFQQKTSIGSKKTTQATPTPIGNLFFADLEYNPDTKVVTQIRTGTTSGQPQTSPSHPLATTAGQFVYKVDVHTKDKKLIEQYWQAMPQAVIKTSTGAFKFRVTSVYQPEAIVKLSLLDNTLLWTGIMK